MKSVQAISQYEVSCPRCKVTFPIGTRSCIHCGGPTGPSALARPDGWISVRPAGPESVVSSGPAPEPLEAELAEEVAGGQSKARALMPLLWLALAIGFSVLRSCGSE